MTDLSNIPGSQGGLDSILAKFEQGQHDQVPDSQLHQSYEQTAAQLPRDQYVQAAEQAFSKLTPEQRAEFARMLQAKAGQYGVPAPQAQSAPTDPGGLASAVGEVHAQQPNLLQQMFAPGGTFSNPIAKAALLGITAMAAQRLMGARR
jgi:hypothetical protein